jgi:hypothetical protein
MWIVRSTLARQASFFTRNLRSISVAIAAD